MGYFQEAKENQMKKKVEEGIHISKNPMFLPLPTEKQWENKTKQKEIIIYDLWFIFPLFSQQPNGAYMLSTVSISASRSETYDQCQIQWLGTLGNESQTLKSYE